MVEMSMPKEKKAYMVFIGDKKPENNVITLVVKARTMSDIFYIISERLKDSEEEFENLEVSIEETEILEIE